jgi:arylsulfatase A-like enzyme
MLHIPCWMYLPKSLRAAQRAGLLANRQRVVSNLDIVPTLMDLLGLGQVPQVHDIQGGLWGGSLARALPPQRVVVAANGGRPAQVDEGFLLLRGTERLQYLGGEARPRFRFTDLASDPGQTRNLWNTLSRPEQAQWRRILGSYPQLERNLLPLLNAAGPPR